MTTLSINTPIGTERWEHWGGRGQTGRCAWCNGRIWREEKYINTENAGWINVVPREFRWVHMGYENGDRVSRTHCKAPGAPEGYAGMLIKRKAPRRRFRLDGTRRPRDSQKSKCYAWEREAIPRFWACAGRAPYHKHGDNCGLPMTIEECQRFTDEVAHVYRHPIKVRAGRGGGHGGYGSIHLGVAARTKPIVLHEIAHCLAPYHEAGHGPLFIRVYINLLTQFLGMNARELRASARKAGLKVATKDKVAKPKRRKKPSRAAKASSPGGDSGDGAATYRA